MYDRRGSRRRVKQRRMAGEILLIEFSMFSRIIFSYTFKVHYE